VSEVTTRRDEAGVDEVGAFAREHGPALTRFAYLLTGGRAAQAQDLVQSVLTTLVSRGLEGLDHPLGYARTALLNEHRSQGRRSLTEQRWQPRLVEAPLDDGAQEGTTGDRLVLLAALRELTDREREVVVLRYFLDLPDAEIAESLGCRRATVRSLAHRALPKLRQRLGEDYRAHRSDRPVQPSTPEEGP
jgi:RNA polymerase sigma factor (sigma-70 family)